MDIVDALNSYQEAVNTSQWVATLTFPVAVGGCLLIVLLSLDSLFWQKGRFSKVRGGLGFAFGVIWLIGSITVGSVMNPAPEARNHLAETISTEAEEVHDAKLPVDQIEEALSEDAENITLISGVHDGVKKSLGLEVDWDAKTATVYEGNVALDPGQ